MKHVPSRGGLAAVLSLSAAALSRGVVAQRPNNAPARAPRIRADFAVADGVTWVDVLANDDAARGGGELRVTEILGNNNDDDDDDNIQKMVLYVLYAKADLEGVTSLSLIPGSDICVSVRNTLTRDQKRERIVIESSELHQADVPDHEKHRAEHSSHFALTWEGEHNRSTIQVIKEDDGEEETTGKKKAKKKASIGDNIITRDIQPHDDGQFVPILKLECDGLEPYAFHPMGNEFSVINTGGTKVYNVDLSTGEWSDYDLSSGSSLVKNFDTKFE
mmetsp:Transcript_32516/g.69212  ORF Transcript_32516/g.69212 Transcript_32516/m.69212 type:complete len:275 (+) Transcript_32516:172-996(+)